jgi:hypothetical protein
MFYGLEDLDAYINTPDRNTKFLNVWLCSWIVVQYVCTYTLVIVRHVQYCEARRAEIHLVYPEFHGGTLSYTLVGSEFQSDKSLVAKQ